MKTRTQVIEESVKHWYEHHTDEYLNSDEPHLIDFDAEMIQDDLDLRDCRHVLGAVAHGINEEWADFLYRTADEELERADPYAYYGLNRSDF